LCSSQSERRRGGKQATAHLMDRFCIHTFPALNTSPNTEGKLRQAFLTTIKLQLNVCGWFYRARLTKNNVRPTVCHGGRLIGLRRSLFRNTCGIHSGGDSTSKVTECLTLITLSEHESVMLPCVSQTKDRVSLQSLCAMTT
jgi:hypothetical protein